MTGRLVGSVTGLSDHTTTLVAVAVFGIANAFIATEKAVAAGADVVVLGTVAKAGHPISLWRFTRHGLLVTAVTLVVASVYAWMRYFALM